MSELPSPFQAEWQPTLCPFIFLSSVGALMDVGAVSTFVNNAAMNSHMGHLHLSLGFHSDNE